RPPEPPAPRTERRSRRPRPPRLTGAAPAPASPWLDGDLRADAPLARPRDHADPDGHVLHRDPLRLEEGDLVRLLAARVATGQHLAQLVHVVPTDHTLRERCHEVAAFHAGLFQRVRHDQPRAAYGLDVELGSLQ